MFEYKIINQNINILSEEELNYLGKKKWELVSYNTTPIEVDKTSMVRTINYKHSYIFKRSK